jgi:hypothetical protein
MLKAAIPAWRALLVCAGAFASVLAHSAVPEHELELAITYRVAKFVQWPKMHGGQHTFRFCVYQENPFQDELEKLQEREVNGLPIEVLITGDLELIGSSCQLLFIPESRAPDLPAIVVALSSLPVLTISDQVGFANAGGIVELRNINNKIGFRINVDAYENAGLGISSQLLQLAELVSWE